MSRVLTRVAAVIILVLVAVYGWLWLSAQRTIPLAVSPADRAAAVAHADRIADLGSEPEKWPVRLFIPASALQDIAGTIAGTSYRMPFGGIGPNGPDGYLVATIRKLEFVPNDFRLRTRVEMDVSYAPAGKTQWWGDATIRFTGEADMLPVHDRQHGSETLNFRLIPTGFSPAIRWGPLNYAATEMLSQVVASHLLERVGRDLIIPIPALAVPIDIRSGMVSTHEGSFPAGGSYKLTTQFDGRPLQGEISTDRLLIVSSGVWLLGGLPDTPAPSPSLRRAVDGRPSELDQRALATKARLAPFERTSGNAEAHIPIAAILALFKQLEPEVGGTAAASAEKANYDVSAAITEASGTLFKTKLVSNRIVGDISLAVLPASPDFASGTLSLAPLGLQWQKGIGLTGQLDATIHARAQIRAYLSSSRMSQALRADLPVNGSTKTSIPFTLGLKYMRAAAGSAIMLAPDVRCTRVGVDLRQDEGAGPLFSTAWYTLQSAGVRVERNIGGGAGASIGLLDSKPRYVAFPVEGPLAQRITYPSDGIALTIAPKTLVMGEDGIDVAVSLHARSAGKAEQASFAAQRAALLATLRKGLPAKPCVADQRFKLLL